MFSTVETMPLTMAGSVHSCSTGDTVVLACVRACVRACVEETMRRASDRASNGRQTRLVPGPFNAE